jgi:hypothetical protein
MNAFAADPFDPSAVSRVRLDVYTGAYRVSGAILTRFGRVADILNQVTSTHLVLEHATVSEYADPTATLGAQQVHVALNEVLLCVAATTGEARPGMRIEKRPVKAQIGIPPFRVTGTVHVPQGSRPADGLLNASDRFLAMTDATIASAGHPELDRTADAVAIQRALAHVVLVADDERPDELLAEILDERTAQDWLNAREPAAREAAPRDAAENG